MASRALSSDQLSSPRAPSIGDDDNLHLSDQEQLSNHSPYTMEHHRSSIQDAGFESPTWLNDRSQLVLLHGHQGYQNGSALAASAANAPRSLSSGNWRTGAAGDRYSWPEPRQSDYTLSNLARPRGSSVVDRPLNGYAYCLDRGNGEYTRLIPADMLPAMNEIPARQAGPGGMVILPALDIAPPQGAAAMDRPVTLKTSFKEPGQVSDGLQNHIDNIIATSPSTSKRDKKEKIFCDKWVHEGVCAFAQQGCKYLHEMPLDKATQYSLGLFQGLPTWWKKHQAEQQRLQEAGEILSTPTKQQSAGNSSAKANSRGATAAVPSLTLPRWRKDNKTTNNNGAPRNAMILPDETRPTRQLESVRPYSNSGSSSRPCVWGPIEPPQKRGHLASPLGSSALTTFACGDAGF